MADITFFGMTMEFSAIENMMDPDIKAQIIANLSDEQAIVDEYIKAHKEKFGTDFLQM